MLDKGLATIGEREFFGLRGGMMMEVTWKGKETQQEDKKVKEAEDEERECQEVMAMFAKEEGKVRKEKEQMLRQVVRERRARSG